MYGLLGFLLTYGENFMSAAPLEIHLLRKIVTCSILILPAVYIYNVMTEYCKQCFLHSVLSLTFTLKCSIQCGFECGIFFILSEYRIISKWPE